MAGYGYGYGSMAVIIIVNINCWSRRDVSSPQNIASAVIIAYNILNTSSN